MVVSTVQVLTTVISVSVAVCLAVLALVSYVLTLIWSVSRRNDRLDDRQSDHREGEGAGVMNVATLGPRSSRDGPSGETQGDCSGGPN
jgi:hypothetical protein